MLALQSRCLRRPALVFARVATLAQSRRNILTLAIETSWYTGLRYLVTYYLF